MLSGPWYLPFELSLAVFGLPENIIKNPESRKKNLIQGANRTKN